MNQDFLEELFGQLHEMDEEEEIDIEQPAYYLAEGYELMDVIEAFELPFSRAGAVKYLFRAGRKPGVSLLEDLLKARVCLDIAIARAEMQDVS